MQSCRQEIGCIVLFIICLNLILRVVVVCCYCCLIVCPPLLRITVILTHCICVLLVLNLMVEGMIYLLGFVFCDVRVAALVYRRTVGLDAVPPQGRLYMKTVAAAA
jgi:hypothetical protein